MAWREVVHRGVAILCNTTFGDILVLGVVISVPGVASNLTSGTGHNVLNSRLPYVHVHGWNTMGSDQQRLYLGYIHIMIAAVWSVWCLVSGRLGYIRKSAVGGIAKSQAGVSANSSR